MSSKNKKAAEPDFRAARPVKAPGLQTILGYLDPKRTESEVYLQDEIDATELMKYLERKNASHPEYKTTIFHCAVVGMARMVRERPLMNRYIQGNRMYERKHVSISFVVKRRFADGADESLMVLVPGSRDTLDTVSRKICGDIIETRKSEHSTGGVDQLLDKLAALPRPILMPIVGTVRALDFWGINPDFLTDGDPHFTTILASNLGSISCPSVYHHLSNYGTNSIVITIGTLHDEEKLMPDGHKEIRRMLDVGATLDERIGDGFYFARSLRLIRHIFEERPELLDQPLGKPSGFKYE